MEARKGNGEAMSERRKREGERCEELQMARQGEKMGEREKEK